MELTRRDAIAALAGAGIVVGGSAAALSRDGFDVGPSGTDSTADDPTATGRMAGNPAATDPTATGQPAVDGTTDDPLSPDEEDVVEALVVTAEVVYPSAVENVRPFVEIYATTKLDRRPEFGDGASDSLDTLDAESQFVFDDPYVELNVAERETVLGRLGVDEAASDPDGSAVERVRYYVVNEVLYALYTSPTGGELVGLENPQGHPGGTDSYQRGPSG